MAETLVTGYQVLPVTAIRESAVNPRTVFDGAALSELADSILEHGVMVPLLVRPVNGHFELVDGARRYRAAQLAGLDQVPVVVEARESDGAREAALVANLQRADVAPLDEARAFHALLPIPVTVGLVSELARRIGKAPRYVWDRLKLLDLVPVAQQLLEAGRITVPHATVLARLTAEQQERAIREGLFEHEAALSLLDDDQVDDFDEFDDEAPLKVAQFIGRKARSVRELEAWVARNVRFDVAAAAVAAPLDFGPVAERVGEATAQPGRGKKVVHVTYDSYVQPEAKTDGERTYCRQSWKRADGHDEDSPTCESSVLGVIVVGPGYGQAFPVCIDKACGVHWAAEQRERAKRLASDGSGPETTKQAKAREEQDRKWKDQQEREERQRAEWKKAQPALLKAAVAAVQKAKPLTLAPMLLARIWAADRKALEQLLGAPKTGDDVVRFLALRECQTLIDSTDSGPRDFPAIAKALGVDVKAIVKAANEPAAPAAKKGSAKAAKNRKNGARA